MAGTFSSTHLSSSSIEASFFWSATVDLRLLLDCVERILTESKISFSWSSSLSSSSSLSISGVNANRWLLFDGLQRIMIISRIKENNMCQNPSSSQSSFQSYFRLKLFLNHFLKRTFKKFKSFALLLTFRQFTKRWRTKDHIINTTLAEKIKLKNIYHLKNF